MTKVFISYRSEDSETTAERIHSELLNSGFKKSEVFFSNESISPGDKFPNRIKQAASECEIMLVLIGDIWEGILDRNSKKRLYDKNDWVRQEIEIVLDRDATIIPILVNGANMPEKESLPESLLLLHDKHYHEVREGKGRTEDLEALVKEVKAKIGHNKRPGVLLVISVVTVIIIVFLYTSHSSISGFLVSNKGLPLQGNTKIESTTGAQAPDTPPTQRPKSTSVPKSTPDSNKGGITLDTVEEVPSPPKGFFTSYFTGTVKDGTGKAIEGATVSCNTCLSSTPGITDSAGNFKFHFEVDESEQPAIDLYISYGGKTIKAKGGESIYSGNLGTIRFKK